MAPYLADCLRSCLALAKATLQEGEWEIIAVDDGSTDASAAILAREACHEPAIRVVHEDNSGQSVARNLALSMARGSYIYMVDADDDLLSLSDAPARSFMRRHTPHSAAEALPVAWMRQGVYDIIGVQVAYQPLGQSLRPWSHQQPHWPFNKVFATGADFLRHHNVEGLVYGYLFRRALFEQHPDLRFTPGIYHQDEEWICKTFSLAGATCFHKGYLYRYYERPGSSLHTPTEARRKKLLEDFLVVIDHLQTWGAAHHNSHVLHYKVSYLAMDVLRYVIRKGYEEEAVCHVIHFLRQQHLYPLPWLKNAPYLGMKALTAFPSLIKFWTRHPALARRIGF